MKTKEIKKADFHTVDFFRNIKEEIAKELNGKTFEQQKELLQKYLNGDLKLKLTK